MRVKSAASLIANATRRFFGAVTSRMSPPSATLIGPIANVLRSRPPLAGPIRNGSAKPGTFTIPPLLEKAADSSVSGHPRHIIPPVKYSAEIRPWTLHGDFFRHQAPRADVPTSVYIHVQARVIGTFRQVPSMNLPGTSLHRKFPVSWTVFLVSTAFRRAIKRKHSAQSVILSAQEPEGVRQRRLAPVQSDFRGLQPRRSTRDVARHFDRSC